MPCPRCGAQWVGRVVPDGGTCPTHGFVPRDEISRAGPSTDDKRPAEPQQVEIKKRSLADRLVGLVEGSGALLFHDEFEEPHAALHGDGRLVVRLRSKAFRRWLSKLAWEELHKAAGGEALQGALSVLEAKAVFDGPTVPLHVRVAWHDEAIWYDLGDGRAVRVRPDGWEIKEQPPILFRRFPHQKPQAEPRRGGSLDSLFRFVNVKTGSLTLLFKCDIVSGLVPDIPHTVTAVHGPQGSAKTTMSKAKKELLDPSVVQSFTPPDNLREFVQLASHHYFLPLDNLTSLPDWLSDALCRMVTGDGFSKRELFTNDDDVVYAFRRVAAINGINLVVSRPDLLDRSLLYELTQIPKDERREDRELWEAFEEAKPGILGAMFDLLAGAMRELPNIRPSELPRMADFARWGCAIAVALGFDARDFLDAYAENIGRQTEEAISASPVAQTVVALMESRDEWQGTPSELLGALEDVGVGARLLRQSASGNVSTRGWPGAAHVLSRHLNLVRNNLLDLGISIEERRGNSRLIVIRRDTRQEPESSDGSDASVVSNLADRKLTDGTVATDARSPASEAWEVEIE